MSWVMEAVRGVEVARRIVEVREVERASSVGGDGGGEVIDCGVGGA